MSLLPVLVAAALLVGVASGAVHPEPPWPVIAVAAAAWAATVWAWWHGRPRALVACAVCALVGLGAVAGGAAMRRALTPSLVQMLEREGALPAPGARDLPPIRLEGRLAADAAPTSGAVLLRVDVARVWLGACGCPELVEGRVLAVVGGDAARTARDAWRAGRLVQLTATLRRPLSYRNLGASDAAVELARRRTVLIASVKSAYVVEVRADGTWRHEVAAALRARARRAIARAAGEGTDATAVATAVLIGDRAGLSAPLEDRLQRAGTFHVIAISGGNIALWSLITLWTAARLTRRRPLALAAVAAILVLYAAVVGGGASVMRATGMALVGIATQWLDQRGAVVNVLALTTAALVVVDPLLIFDIGFWLTTAATAGLALGMAGAGRTESRVRAVARALVLTSVWAEAALLPIVAAVFQQVTLAGVALSALAIPAMGVVQVAALAAVLADAVVPSLLATCGTVLTAATAVVTESARLVDTAPWLSWRVPPPSWIAVLVYALAVVMWLVPRRHAADTARMAHLRRATGVAAPAAAVWIACSPLTLVAWPPGDLRIHVLDVGQGDAVLLQFPNGTRMLVDAGGASADGRDLGQRVVGPTLRARGIRRLDYLVVTHADLDHIGGAATLVREFRPAEVWMGVPVAGDAASAVVRAAADAVGARWRESRRGERIDVGAVQLRVVHPPPPDWERQRVRNDDSVVLAIRHGDVRVLLTGDVGAAVEPEIAAAIDAADSAPPPLTVLKVAHHGSAGSTGEAWLRAVRPSLAIVSAGATNPFGHPSEASLTRLGAVGGDVWRTDRDGEVSVRTNGRVVEVRAFTGRTRWLVAQPR
ncbi:MAG: DNA internalization-related competence protein ComEC/Rec2 [Acidobacteria bacterium]|nr:DNA internalization-related competence protein ComEC/Rec2 [Acidobacteriota bacterium]